MKKDNFKKLSFEELKWECPEDVFNFNSTKEVAPLEKIVGQPRAIEAIRLGAKLDAVGYNIFVTGLSGTGRTSAVEQILKNIIKESEKVSELYDLCFVNNFNEPDKPRLIRLQKGLGPKFSKDMDDTVSFLRSRLPKQFEENTYRNSRNKIIDDYQNKEQSLIEQFDRKIKPEGFLRGQLELETGDMQPEVFPVIDDKPVRIDEIDKLVIDKKISKKEADRITENYKKFRSELMDIARQGMKLMQKFKNELRENDKKSAKSVVDSTFEFVLNKYHTEKVVKYINEVKNYILENLNLFVNLSSNLPQFAPEESDQIDTTRFKLFKVNVLIDNSETSKAPIIIETSPTYSNLFGTIEKHYNKSGNLTTDFSMIKAGSLLQADQGYLIVNANDLFGESGVWQKLKRVLLYNRLEIQPYDSYFQLTQSYVKPEKIRVNVKVIIIGGQTLYNTLYHYEKGFKKIFKVNARFDDSAKNNEEMIQNYASFINKICSKENLNHCSPSGVSALIEWAVKRAGSKNKITLRFSDVADILREAAFYDQNDNSLIDREDVEHAICQRNYRNNLFDEKIMDSILEESTMIATSGERVGQINGLTIYDTGNFTFGKPARITGTVSAGNKGIINVDREADMSGKIHNKGILILSGFLREKFARTKPLSLSASIAFEQNYGGIDGDSASAAEIYVILSAISEMPINQEIAITGSVNQKGDIQPIGGVNEKIRGFYEICKARGFTGNQAVIIPKQNEKDLMLDVDIINDVKEDNFAIYSIKTIDEGVKLLFGIEAGEFNKTVGYPAKSLYGKVVKILKQFTKENEKEKKK